MLNTINVKYLFIDIASHDGAIACVDDSNLIACIPCENRTQDGQLLSVIEQGLEHAKWTYSDLTSLACVIGPGGFTSLRMTTSCANTLADQLDIPASGVHLSDLLFARAQKKDLLWLHSTKRTELFVRGFGKYASLWPDPTHVMLEDLITQVPDNALWTGELLPQHAEALSKFDLKDAKLFPHNQFLPSFLNKLEYKKDLLLPWYGRTP